MVPVTLSAWSRGFSFRLVHGPNQLLRVAKKYGPSFGQNHATRTANKELNVEMLLQHRDVVAQRGLGDVKAFGRLRDRAELGGSQKIPKATSIDRHRDPDNYRY